MGERRPLLTPGPFAALGAEPVIRNQSAVPAFWEQWGEGVYGVLSLWGKLDTANPSAL